MSLASYIRQLGSLPRPAEPGMAVHPLSDPATGIYGITAAAAIGLAAGTFSIIDLFKTAATALRLELLFARASWSWSVDSFPTYLQLWRTTAPGNGALVANASMARSPSNLPDLPAGVTARGPGAAAPTRFGLPFAQPVLAFGLTAHPFVDVFDAARFGGPLVMRTGVDEGWELAYTQAAHGNVGTIFGEMIVRSDVSLAARYDQ